MRTIFLCAIFATLCGVGLMSPLGIHEQIMIHGKTCFAENGVTEADFGIFKKANVDPADVKDNMKCAMHCVMLKSGFMDANGKFIPEAIKPSLNERELQTFEKAYQECDAVTGSNPCETAFLTFGCMMEHKA